MIKTSMCARVHGCIRACVCVWRRGEGRGWLAGACIRVFGCAHVCQTRCPHGTFGTSFGSRYRPYWDYFELRGGPGEALEPLRAAPVRPHLETWSFCFILGSPWGPFWDHVGTNFRLCIRSGNPCLTFGILFGIEGPDSVSNPTSRPSQWTQNCYG